MNMFVKLTWKCLLYITNVWCLPREAQTHGYHSLTSYYASVNGTALHWQTSSNSSCFYNLRYQSKSAANSILYNYLSYSKVHRKAHLSAHQLLQGKKRILNLLVKDNTFHFSRHTVFLLKTHGYFFLKNFDTQALNYFKTNSYASSINFFFSLKSITRSSSETKKNQVRK